MINSCPFILALNLNLRFCLFDYDSTYASKYIPIIASVSEHQPPTWPSYFTDINVLAFLVPAGIIVSLNKVTIFFLLVIWEVCEYYNDFKISYKGHYSYTLINIKSLVKVTVSSFGWTISGRRIFTFCVYRWDLRERILQGFQERKKTWCGGCRGLCLFYFSLLF